MTKHAETELEYAIADDDVDDTYVFRVATTRGALSVKWRLSGTDTEGEETVASSVMKSAEGVFVFSQGSRAGESDWSPPFAVSSAVRTQLAAGEVVLRTGLDDASISLARVEIGELSSEGVSAAKAFGAPVLVGRGGEAELVVSATEPAQLVWLRIHEACTVTWRAGVLPGKAVKIAKPKAPKKGASPLDDLRTGSRPKRIAAAKKLSGSTDPLAIEALLEASCDDDYQVAGPAGDALRASLHAAKSAGTPFDLLPIARARLAVATDFEDQVGPRTLAHRALERALGQLSAEIQRPEVVALYVEIAWQRKLGGTSINAATRLVSHGHAESIERASRLFGHAIYGIAAVGALLALPAAVGVPRALSQIETASDDVRQRHASAFVRQAADADPAYLDVALRLEPHLGAPEKRLLSETVEKSNAIQRGRRDAVVARCLFYAHYWSESHDALLALLPDDALDADAARVFVERARNGGDELRAATKRFPTAMLVRTVDARMAQDDWFTVPHVVGMGLLARRAEEPSVVAQVRAYVESARARGDHGTAAALEGALAAT